MQIEQVRTRSLATRSACGSHHTSRLDSPYLLSVHERALLQEEEEEGEEAEAEGDEGAEGEAGEESEEGEESDEEEQEANRGIRDQLRAVLISTYQYDNWMVYTSFGCG
jgi:hypothetical protein